MKYMGSKAKYAEQLLVAMGDECKLSDYENWVEPFVGGANMIAKVTSKIRWGSDINPYLIRMFQAVQKGWEPSDFYSEGEYQAAREKTKLPLVPSLNDAAEIGFIGLGCSYSGKWFGGYARGNANNGSPRNYTKESKDNLLKQKPFIQGVFFSEKHYNDTGIPESPSIVYCDPPYALTTKYNHKERFESDKFWGWCNEMVERGHKVFVSEYRAPEGWRCLWEKVVNSSLTKETGSKKATERLFTK